MDAVDEISFQVEKLDGSPPVSSVPEAVVALLPVRGLIVHQKHVFLLAGDIGNHLPGKGTPQSTLIFFQPKKR